MESQVKRHVRGLDVLMVPALGVPSRGDAEEAHGDKQRSIYILPGMLEAYKARFAYQRMVRRSNP